MAAELHLRPHGRLAASAVEQWLEAAVHAEAVKLHVGAWRGNQMLAEAYLQGFLALMARLQVKVTVDIPKTSFVGDRLETAFRIPLEDSNSGLLKDDTLTPSERVLGGTLGGLIVGHFADVPQRIVERQRAAVSKGRHLFVLGPQAALVSLVEKGPVRRPAATDVRRRYERLGRQLRRMLAVFNNDDRAALAGSERDPTDAFEWMLMFAHEAIENTGDHGQVDLDRQAIPMVRFLQLRRVDLEHIDRISEGVDGAVRAYLTRLNLRFDSEQRRRSRRRLIELTVGDGGLGIPAWLADDVTVYQRDHQEEMKYLCEALLPDRTTKSLWEVGRGQGFLKMLQSAYALDGFVMIRTGRSTISRTYLNENGSRESPDFEQVFSDAFLVERSGERPLMAGTVVSLLFPLPSKT